MQSTFMYARFMYGLCKHLVPSGIVTVPLRYDALPDEVSKVDMKMAYGAEYGLAFAKMGISPYFYGYIRNGCMAW